MASGETVDEHDVQMLTDVARILGSDTEATRYRSGRLLAIAGLLNRHHAELAECEHGALKGRCEEDGCEREDFEFSHVVNKATRVEKHTTVGRTLEESVDTMYFTAADFRDLTRLAWVGARVLAARDHQPLAR
jgi:hypothetical protein